MALGIRILFTLSGSIHPKVFFTRKLYSEAIFHKLIIHFWTIGFQWKHLTECHRQVSGLFDIGVVPWYSCCYKTEYKFSYIH